jgi:hypothetical protein
MADVAWPLTNHPGEKPQEGTGRLINVFAEPRGNEQGAVWRRVPGVGVFARSPSVGSAIGSATCLGVSSVVEAAGEAIGTAVADAVGEGVEA